MSTLIRIPSGHMRFIPAHKQADDATMELTPAKWPVELILIANDLGREAYLDPSRIQTILAPAIQTTCQLTAEETIFFPPPLHSSHSTSPRMTAYPSRSLPHSPAVSTQSHQQGPSTPPLRLRPGLLSLRAPPEAVQATIAARLSASSEGYTSSQALPEITTMPPLAGTHTILPPTSGGSPPIPHRWTPKFIPENWVYTDGSDIEGHPRLGAAVVHVPTATTIYIDAAGTEETRTIMRAELVAIHTALTTLVDHEWIGIFTDSLSSLQAIQHHHAHPGTRSTKDYHHHRILLDSISDILETRRIAGHSTTLHKIRAHTNIRGNDLADAAAKMAVRSFDTLPAHATIRVDIGEVAPRPQHWVGYTANPPPLELSPGARWIPATNTRAWWTIPEEERLQMHAFTRPSLQLRLKVRNALLRSLHYTSLYRRLLVANKLKGARLQVVGRAIHKKLNSTPKEGTALLKFMYGQLYNGKIAMRYGYAPTDECPLCHKPDSCTHIAGECRKHEGLRIGRHNAACQLIHAAIRKSSKGGGALHAAPELILVSADAGTLSQTTADSISNLSTQDGTLTPLLGREHTPIVDHSQTDWLEPIPTRTPTRQSRRMDVSLDPRYNPGSLSAATSDAECTAAPRRIPEWVLSHEEIQALHTAGHGTAPDLIYARGVPDSPSPDPTSFNKKLCTLIIVEIGFCRDLGCEEKREAKANKYIPLITELKKHWGTVEFVAFPIGHAGTTLKTTLDQLTIAFSTARPRGVRPGAAMASDTTVTDHTARTHDYNLFKSLLDSLTDLAQSRLLGIINNRRRLVAALQGNVSRQRASSTPATPHHTGHQTRVSESVDMDTSQDCRPSTGNMNTRKRALAAVGKVRRNRAHSAAAPAPTQAVTQQETASHIHRTRTTRVHESTAIT